MAKTEKTLSERLATQADNLITSGQYGIKRFEEMQAKHGICYAFEWADDSMQAAARLDVGGTVKRWMAAQAEKGRDAELCATEIVAHLTGEALRSARYPTRSTSPCSNAMAQYKAAAQAEIIDKLTGGF